LGLGGFRVDVSVGGNRDKRKGNKGENNFCITVWFHGSQRNTQDARARIDAYGVFNEHDNTGPAPPPAQERRQRKPLIPNGGARRVNCPRKPGGARRQSRIH
jgi:hypothetical protein